MVVRPASVPQLKLAFEAKLTSILPEGGSPRGEASGVLARGDELLIIFDDSTVIGVVRDHLNQSRNDTVAPTPPVADGATQGVGYEDLARDADQGLIYLLVEASLEQGRLFPRIEIVDDAFVRISEAILDYPLEAENKGMEGLTLARGQDGVYLLGLCEGNLCRGGAEGRRPGGGRIQLFRPGDDKWAHAGTLTLPPYLWFIDYSSLALRGERLAVTSQQSSAVWIGTFDPDARTLTHPGQVYEFPRQIDGSVAYGTVEGVTWLDDDHLGVVSDRASADEPGWREKDRSLHIFTLP